MMKYRKSDIWIPFFIAGLGVIIILTCLMTDFFENLYRLLKSL